MIHTTNEINDVEQKLCISSGVDFVLCRLALEAFTTFGYQTVPKQTSPTSGGLLATLLYEKVPLTAESVRASGNGRA